MPQPHLFVAAVLAGLACGCSIEPMPESLAEYGWRTAEREGDLVPLDDKAALIETELHEHHLTPEGLYAYRVPLPHRKPPIAEPSDAAAWTALWAIAETFRFRVTGEPEAQALRDRLLRGLDHLCRVSGTPGVLARTMVPWTERRRKEDAGSVRHWEQGRGEHRGLSYADYAWKTDNSKDLLICWVLAVHLGLQDLEPGPLRDDLLEDLLVIEQRIVDADFSITEPDGSPVQFGDLHPAGNGWPRFFLGLPWWIPLDLVPGFDFAIGTNAAMSAALVRIRDAHTEQPSHWPSLASDWPEAIEDGVYRPLGWTKYNNSFLSMVALWAVLETSPNAELRQSTAAAVADLWSVHRHDRNALFTAVALLAGAVPQKDRESALRNALYSLHVQSLDGTIRSIEHRELDGVERRFWRRSFAAHPLPTNLQTSSSNQWKSDPTRLVRDEAKAGRQTHGRMDFLLGWWFLRELLRRGVVDPPTWRSARSLPR